LSVVGGIDLNPNGELRLANIGMGKCDIMGERFDPKLDIVELYQLLMWGIQYRPGETCPDARRLLSSVIALIGSGFLDFPHVLWGSPNTVPFRFDGPDDNA
jgi:hypothetical protein